MITVDFDNKIFTAVENQDNGNVEVYLTKEAREALGLGYPHIAVEVSQGNPLDSGIGIAEDNRL
tara:strand:+ start:416 stop:607 length:192 start_codon:yes stop_codon:yes gene_type:complete